MLFSIQYNSTMYTCMYICLNAQDLVHNSNRLPFQAQVLVGTFPKQYKHFYSVFIRYSSTNSHIRTHSAYARDHQPCIIFMDEIDAIGGRRFSEGTSADREIQRTLMELLNQMDGFDKLGQVECTANTE